MKKDDNRGIFAVLLSSFDELDLLLQKMIDYAFMHDSFISLEYPISSAFKAFRMHYQTLLSYSRDMLSEDNKADIDKIKILDERHKRVVSQRSRFESFMNTCRIVDFSSELPF